MHSAGYRTNAVLTMAGTMLLVLCFLVASTGKKEGTGNAIAIRDPRDRDRGSPVGEIANPWVDRPGVRLCV